MRAPYSYRDDPAVPAFADDRPLIVFDGYCVLCSTSAQFVLRHDARGIYRLLAAQTPLGRALYLHSRARRRKGADRSIGCCANGSARLPSASRSCAKTRG